MIQKHPAQEARSFLMPPSDIPTSEWGKTNHELSLASSSCAGPWSTDLIPYLKFYLDCLDSETIRTVVLQKPTQEAGSETTLVWLKRVAVEDPGPAMWVFADEETAKKFCTTRILPAFRSCHSIAPLIDEAKLGQKEIILKNGFSLIMTWASSIPATASVSIRYLIMDEICKPAYYMTQKEGNVIKRITQRTNRFPNRKIVMLSSVTIEGDNMALEMAKTDAAYDFNVPCPYCGEEQPMAFSAQKPTNDQLDRGDHPAFESTGRIVFPEDGTNEERSDLAKYECRSCLSQWSTVQKNRAVPLGKWKARPNAKEKIRSVGIFFSRLISLSEGGRFDVLAREFLDSKNDPENLQSLINNAFGEHWKPYKIKSELEELKKAMCELPALEVPEAADCIVVSVDMQQTGFWYVVRAWSSKFKDSWMIECGQIADWDDVDELFFEKTWKQSGGKELGCWRGALDIGGSKELGKEVSRTEEAESWWIQNRHRARRKIFLCKGSSRSLPTMVNIGKILETTPSGKKIAHGGLQIIELNTGALKDLFFHAINQASDKSSGAAYLNSKTPDTYFRHITAEAKDEHGNYIRIGKDNHWLDCEMMQQGMVSRELYGGMTLLVKAKSDKPSQPIKIQSDPMFERGYSGLSDWNPFER